MGLEQWDLDGPKKGKEKEKEKKNLDQNLIIYVKINSKWILEYKM